MPEGDYRKVFFQARMASYFVATRQKRDSRAQETVVVAAGSNSSIPFHFTCGAGRLRVGSVLPSWWDELFVHVFYYCTYSYGVVCMYKIGVLYIGSYTLHVQ